MGQTRVQPSSTVTLRHDRKALDRRTQLLLARPLSRARSRLPVGENEAPSNRGKPMVQSALRCLPLFIFLFLLMGVPGQVDAFQKVRMGHAHVTVFNLIGDVRVVPREAGGDERVEVTVQNIDGGFFDRRRITLRARPGAISVVLPAHLLYAPDLEEAARLAISSDWRFGDGVTVRDTVTLSPDPGSRSLKVDVEVIVPSGKAVTVRWVYGRVEVVGMAEPFTVKGLPRSITVENVAGSLRITEDGP